jgi:hypothetical protein
MDISVTNTGDDAYTVTIGESEVVLNGNDLKRLLREGAKYLAPVPAKVPSPAEKTARFIRRIKVADDIGIQKLLGIAAHVDVLVLLKSAEGDRELVAKLYGNMSERSRKMCEEDLEYRFKESIPDADVEKAIGRLAAAANELENQET